MKRWERTRVAERCKGCGVDLKVGTPVQVLKLPDVSRRIIRCEPCAGEPIDLEQLEAFDVAEAGREITTPARHSFEFTGATRDLFDAKMAQAGDE